MNDPAPPARTSEPEAVLAEVADGELLRRYIQEKSDAAFAALVRRHVHLVHSVALRRVNGDAHLAADITQSVFTDLARKASRLVRQPVLAGWLFTSTRFAAAKAVRGEQRRRAREEEAQLMQELIPAETEALDWEKVRPVIDDVLAGLGERDREAILLRFFEGQDYMKIGARLQLGDNSARMRVERALEKLRAALAHRGIYSTSAALALALGSEAVVAAPAALAPAVTGAALAGAGASATGIVATFMTLTNIHIGVAAAVTLAAAGGFAWQLKTNHDLTAEVALYQNQNQALAAVEQQNRQLASTAAEVAALEKDDAELARLQQAAATLQARASAAAKATPAAAPPKNRATAATPVLDHEPRRLGGPAPKYPVDMRVAGIGGQVIVDLVVDANGAVQNPTVVKSTRPEFEAAALASVSGWKFDPGSKGGRAVNTHLQVPIVFSVKNDGPALTPRIWDGLSISPDE